MEYVSRNQASKAIEERTRHRVCEITRSLFDAEKQQQYELRWIFTWSSKKAEQDAQRRSRSLTTVEQALQRIARLLGRYDYKNRAIIQSRIDKVLAATKAKPYLQYTLSGTDKDQEWKLHWQTCPEAIARAEHCDGIMLLCANVLGNRLSTGAAMVKYKEQVQVEQTIDFIKSPVQIRPMWLHSPQRLAGLTLLIMIAVLCAGLLEYQVRHHIAQTGGLIDGLMPEKRDTPYPTAKRLLQAFQDYALVIVQYPDGHEEVHYPKLRPVQQRIWDIMQPVLSPPTLNSG